MSKKIHIQGEEEQAPVEDLSAEDDSDKSPQPTGETFPSTAEAADDALSQKLVEAERLSKEHYDRLLRVSAEFDNYKKRTARQMQDTVRYANEKLAGELLTVVDNLERAIESAATENGGDDPFVQGVTMTLNEVMKILERHHVTPITALGQPFDPALHQAMMQEPSADHPPNTVVREMQKGYLIHGRLLRPSLVVVSKAVDIPSDIKE